MKHAYLLALAFLVLGCLPEKEGIILGNPPCSSTQECPDGLLCCLDGVCREFCSVDRPAEDLMEPDTSRHEPDTTESDTGQPDIPPEDIESPDMAEPDTTEPEDIESPDTTEPDEVSFPDIEPDETPPTDTESDETIPDEWGCSDDICVDPENGLMWERDSPTNTVTWADADAYCNGFLLGGHADWRLPTINELRSIVRGCEATELGGNCQVSIYCNAMSCANYPCFGCPNFGGPGPGGCYWPDEFGGSGLCGWEIWSSTKVMETPLEMRWTLKSNVACVSHEQESRDNAAVVRCIRGM